MLFKGGRTMKAQLHWKMAVIWPFAYTCHSVRPSVGSTGSRWGQSCLPSVKTVLSFTQTHPQSVVFIEPHNTEMGKNVVVPRLQMQKLSLKKSELI